MIFQLTENNFPLPVSTPSDRVVVVGVQLAGGAMAHVEPRDLQLVCVAPQGGRQGQDTDGPDQ